MSNYAVKKIDEMEAVYLGAFKRARAELGVESFGMSIIDLPPNFENYPEHDHAGDGQEEVFMALRGGGEIEIDGERFPLDPDHVARVAAGIKRKVWPGRTASACWPSAATPASSTRPRTTPSSANPTRWPAESLSPGPVAACRAARGRGSRGPAAAGSAGNAGSSRRAQAQREDRAARVRDQLWCRQLSQSAVIRRGPVPAPAPESGEAGKTGCNSQSGPASRKTSRYSLSITPKASGPGIPLRPTRPSRCRESIARNQLLGAHGRSGPPANPGRLGPAVPHLVDLAPPDLDLSPSPATPAPHRRAGPASIRRAPRSARPAPGGNASAAVSR